ncbi:hypothetical protein KAR91_13715 [Candidatus Pacearchaeota archaeon]|nr:hypothetical protein [Candidatus Pacearchaeota archaeon]
MKVDIGHVLYLLEERRKINSVGLEEITFYQNGEEVIIPREIIEEFKYTGLNNIDFISTKMYEYSIQGTGGEDEMSLTDRLDRNDPWFHDADMEDR